MPGDDGHDGLLAPAGAAATVAGATPPVDASGTAHGADGSDGSDGSDGGVPTDAPVHAEER